MTTQTVVHLLRHGEVANPTRILYGRLPGFLLTPLGQQMAEAAARSLARMDVTVVMASPLERAQQTAEPVATQFGIAVEEDPRLIESTNYFEGKTVGVGDGVLKDPRNWWAMRDPFTPSWGERYHTIARRMYTALHDARDAAEGHHAVLVSHQLPIWTLRRYLERRPLWHDPRRRHCGLASLTSVYFYGDTVIGVGYCEPAAHLVAHLRRVRAAKGA